MKILYKNIETFIKMSIDKMTSNDSDIPLENPPKSSCFWKYIKHAIFYIIFIFTIIVDMIVFQNFHEWGSSISILILELIFPLLLARWSDIEYLEILTERILDYRNDN